MSRYITLLDTYWPTMKWCWKTITDTSRFIGRPVMKWCWKIITSLDPWNTLLYITAIFILIGIGLMGLVIFPFLWELILRERRLIKTHFKDVRIRFNDKLEDRLFEWDGSLLMEWRSRSRKWPEPGNYADSLKKFERQKQGSVWAWKDGVLLEWDRGDWCPQDHIFDRVWLYNRKPLKALRRRSNWSVKILEKKMRMKRRYVEMRRPDILPPSDFVRRLVI